LTPGLVDALKDRRIGIAISMRSCCRKAIG
jgi:hypothetical protein